MVDQDPMLIDLLNLVPTVANCWDKSDKGDWGGMSKATFDFINEMKRAVSS